MIFVASLVVFEHYGFIAGPAIVGALGALDLSHVRRREWYKIVINGSADAVALLGAAALFASLPIECASGNVAGSCSERTVSALTYSVVNSVLVAVPVSVATGEPYLRRAPRDGQLLDRSLSRSRCSGSGSGGCTSNSVRQSFRCSWCRS